MMEFAQKSAYSLHLLQPTALVITGRGISSEVFTAEVQIPQVCLQGHISFKHICQKSSYVSYLE